MNFKIPLLLLTISLFSPVKAGYFLQWGNSNTFIYQSDGVTGIAPNIGDSVLIELWYAGADGIIDPFLYDDGSTEKADNSAGDDQKLVLAPTTEPALHTNNGDPFEDFGLFSRTTGGEGPTAGPSDDLSPFLGSPIYIRMFDSDTFAAGAGYVVGPTTVVSDFNDYTVGANSVGFSGGSVTVSDYVLAIPEPSSVMMIAVAVVTLFGMRRRFRG